jgi:lipopolysaccharide export system permease protein
VLLQSGSREEIDRRTGRLNVLTFAENTIDLADSGHGDEHRTRDNTELSIHELLHPGNDVLVLDRAKFLVEAHRRLSAPITTLSYALVALVAVLMGGFRRYGNMLRQLVAILAVVMLLAVGLVVANLAARSPALVPLIWVHAVLPGLLCAIALFAPDRLLFRLPAQARG